VVVNYADHQSQCYVELPWSELEGRMWRLKDRMGNTVYDRQGDDLARHGLYVDLPAWGYYFFEVGAV
jgi:hypothetical protein